MDDLLQVIVNLMSNNIKKKKIVIDNTLMDNLSYFKIITFGNWYEDKEIAAKYLVLN